MRYPVSVGRVNLNGMKMQIDSLKQLALCQDSHGFSTERADSVAVLSRPLKGYLVNCLEHFFSFVFLYANNVSSIVCIVSN
jgi:hypothetical protein